MLSLKALIYFSMQLHLGKKKKKEKTLTAEFLLLCALDPPEGSQAELGIECSVHIQFNAFTSK